MHLFQSKDRSFFGCDDPPDGAAASRCRNPGSIGLCGMKNFIHTGETARGHKTSQNDYSDGMIHRVGDRKSSIPEDEEARENNFGRGNRLDGDTQ